MEYILAGKCLQCLEIAHLRSRRGLVRTRLFQRRAKPTRERLWLPDMQPAAERKCAPSQRLAHPRGKSIDLPHFGAHRSQITAGSQRCLQDDKIVVVTQFCLQTLEVGNERSDAGHQRPCQAQLIPEGFHLFAPAVQRGRLPRYACPLHRVTTATI